MLTVKQLDKMSLMESASFAALVCYSSKLPKVGKLIDVFARLFKVSHHTTLQHKDAYFSFAIEGVSVGDVTFGLHLASPFYNTDQRSGRYAGEMFSSPDFEGMMNYVQKYWPQVSQEKLIQIREYLEYAVAYYQEEIHATAKIAEKFLKAERPYIKDSTLNMIAPKVAQEQLRMFIPVLFPTALVYTINLTALIAMYEEAWTPAMKEITAKMAEEVIAKHPEAIKMFDPDRRRKGEWAMSTPDKENIHLRSAPVLEDLEVSDKHYFVEPTEERKHPVDRLHFAPELMDNAISDITCRVKISVATMGQDQRHRTIKRSEPKFTGDFYLPPLLQNNPAHIHVATTLMRKWVTVSEDLPKTLGMILAPYGAMVEYTKKGTINAIAHEQHKRLCWCAQEEIYYLGVLERKAIAEKYGKNAPILSLFKPACFENGICAEGERMCGRERKLRLSGEYFPRRTV